MRIGFTGSHGTGKTVTSNELRRLDQFKGYYFPPSSARVLKVEGINTSATPMSQLLVMLDRTNNIASFPDVISDRTAIDSWAYSEYQRENVWRMEMPGQPYFDIVDRYVERSMRDIDLLVYFPPYWLPKHDGVRSPVHSYQTEIDRHIKLGLDNFWQGPILTMKNEPVQARVQAILEAI